MTRPSRRGDPGAGQGSPVRRVLRRRRHPLFPPGGACGRSPAGGLLHRGVQPQLPVPPVPEALYGIPGWHRDGRRDGHIAGCQSACRHRAHEDGHAGNQHRPVSRRRRGVLPVALSRAAGRIPRADRPHDQWRRRGGRRAGRRLRHVRRASWLVGPAGGPGRVSRDGQAGAGRPKPVGAGPRPDRCRIRPGQRGPDHCGAREPIRRPGPWKPRPCCANVHR